MRELSEARGTQWDSGWDEHKKRQLRRLARLPLSQKLAWLEEAQRVAEKLAPQAAGRREGKTEPR